MYVHIYFIPLFTYVAYCMRVAERLRKNLVPLSKLSYENMKIHLYAKSVITDIEKIKIDKMTTNDDQMMEVINIVRASLFNNYTEKYKCLLESMEESDDVLLKKTAKQYGKLIIKQLLASLYINKN